MTRPPQDFSAHVHKHASPTVRVMLVLAGSAFVAIGLAGIFLPVLPTTPFLLLAAACYARASRRFYNWLLNNRLFGPTILEWQQHRSIPYRTKLFAIALMAATLTTSIVFFVHDARLRVVLALLGVALAVYMYRIPSRDRA
ncbi:MAG: YbaN family protein [Burkholderiales bacterium]|nr:YbaN family protein [Burkholderiales bacterium]